MAENEKTELSSTFALPNVTGSLLRMMDGKMVFFFVRVRRVYITNNLQVKSKK
jgi:hypothetical protein